MGNKDAVVINIKRYLVHHCVITLCCIFSAVYAGEVRKIVHPDGRVEYTNLTDQQRNIHFTNQSKSSTSSVYKYRNNKGVLAFSDQKPVNADFEVLRFDCYACSLSSNVNWHTTPLNLSAYKQQVKIMAEKYGVEESLVRAVIHAESAFNKNAISRAGAQGLMQLMPATANELGVKDSLNADQNIEGGAKYLSQLLNNFSGDMRLATAAYNAGPGAVSRYNGVPPYAETQAYVKRVAILKKRYAKAD
ncbi:lytic transglycosylase domain-containing protein [Neptuniibacter sp. 1_MG-2023]|uniref:lytic transglycosylase domain-containing protein n=1 Tax=Neptuniibacter sp. 1_MG-2023 TaxID=3062662 RepID=UPI0026E1845B|nr:lytic transglycosylase domain-containing protein [Neptuniibacter sp. 1_MG-2023]MDO6592393.1 lytic transglycosylase domain-containing protein [Neptuniibacter sp. 1_MG-2023]